MALLAAAFSSLAVIQIQQSHFYTTDTFAVSFMTLAVYLAVEIVANPEHPEDEPGAMPKRSAFWRSILTDRLVWLSLLFGLAYGMAMASKGNAYPLALLLPLAFLIRYLKRGQVLSHRQTVLVITALVVCGGILCHPLLPHLPALCL